MREQNMFPPTFFAWLSIALVCNSQGLKLTSKSLKERKSRVRSVPWLLANLFLYQWQCHRHKKWQLLKLIVLHEAVRDS